MTRNTPILSVAVVATLALAVGACAGSDVTATTGSPATTAPVSTTSAPTSTTIPETTTTEPSVTLSVTGPEEVVFDWSSDRCDDFDIPDLPVRAFRDATGQVNLVSAHLETRRSIGESLDSVERQCEPVFVSSHASDPSRWADSEWLASTWTPDGTTVYGLVHNEYHGWERGDCAEGDHFECWYNAITGVVSTDGGNTYRHLVEPPGHLVAAIPHPYVPDSAPVGMFSPSNIV
ncbi:MAG: hypothetical protein R3246_00720, partial [Acidimicrobiia bacterium]|nr:hypothetical protein [Acidimicrobiia bacterium]